MHTSRNVMSLDNATFSYQPQSCWSLMSAHCAPRPTYAVFTKKSAGLPLAAQVLHQIAREA
jgi:hypothetical protein